MGYDILSNKRRFIWLLGVCGFGLAMAIWSSIIDVRQHVSSASPDRIALIATILLNLLVLGLLAGYAWGWIMWRIMLLLRERLNGPDA